MSEARALVNVIGNGVATIVISRTEGELDLARVNGVLDGRVTYAERVAGLVDDNPLGGYSLAPEEPACGAFCLWDHSNLAWASTIYCTRYLLA